MTAAPADLAESSVPIKLRLAGLWTSVMFCYIYADYIELYQPGKLPSMLANRISLGPVSQGVLLVVAALMILPSLMVALFLILPTRLNRLANIVVGGLYTAIMVPVILHAWYFYILFGCVEMLLTALIVWFAWRWPLREAIGRPV